MELSDIYETRPFDYEAALEGQLCAVVRDSTPTPTPVTETTPVTESEGEGESGSSGEEGGATPSTDPVVIICGTGVVKYENSRLNIYVDGVRYQFNAEGKASNKKAKDNGYYLMMAVSKMDANSEGSVGTTKYTTTRVVDGETGAITYETVEEQNQQQLPIDSLNARDQFAVQALREILKVVPDPSSVSKNEITHYCEAAYNWAAFMMAESSKARAVVKDSSSTSGMEMEDTGILDNNTDKLLKNMLTVMEYYVKDGNNTVGLKDLIDAIKGGSGDNDIVVLYAYRNKLEAESDNWAYDETLSLWKKVGYDNVPGEYTDADAKKLPTYRYVQKQSVVEMVDLISSIDKLTAQVKRIADSMSSNS